MFFIVPLAIIMVWLVVEKHLLLAARSCVLTRIHVFGTRGKTTATQVLVSRLRNMGLRVYARTTGDRPEVMLPDGAIRAFFRFGPARVQEYTQLVREAARQHADALVVECMALSPETIRVADEILAPERVVLTNTRPDHHESMGSTPNEIAGCMALCIRSGQRVYVVQDAGFEAIRSRAERQGAELRVLPESGAPLDPIYALTEAVCEDIAISRAAMGLNPDTRPGMSPYMPTEMSLAMPSGVRLPGFQPIRIPGAGFVEFLDIFSANDTISTGQLLRQALAERAATRSEAACLETSPDQNWKTLPLVALLSARADRPLRTKAFAEWIAAGRMFSACAVLGTHAWYGQYALRTRKVRGVLHSSPWLAPESLLQRLHVRLGGSFLLVGLGNAHGYGERMRAFIASRRER